MSRLFTKNFVFAIAVVSGLFGATFALAQIAGYSASFADTSIGAGDSIVVNWTAPATRASNRDWVGLYPTGASDRNYEDWEYLPRTGTNGTVTLDHDTPGTYELRIFSDGYTRAGSGSNTLTIGAGGTGGGDGGGNGGGGNEEPNEPLPPSNYSVSVPAGTYAPGAAVTVSYQRPANASGRSWIGVYEQGASDRNYEEYEYAASGSTQGTVVFNISDVGTYDVRMFSSGYEKVATANNTFTVAAGGQNPDGGGGGEGGGGGGSYALSVSPTSVTAGAAVTVSYQAPASENRSRDWVGMYRTGASDRSFVDWKYVSGSAAGTLSFTPTASGTYDFRYFKNNGFTKVATSPAVTVGAGGSGGNGGNGGGGNGGGNGGQCSVANLTAVTNYPPEDGPVVAFGDSLTAGVGASTGQDYVSQLEQESGVDIINEGVSGDTTEEALARLQSDVLARDPSVVIVWLGGNDIIGRFYERAEDGLEEISTVDWLRLLALRLTGKIPDTTGITEDETFANITEIVERIQATGAVTIVVGFSGGFVDEDLESRYEAVADQTGSLYVPDALDGVLGRPSLMSDLVHPNNEGYGIVADRVRPVLQCVT